MIDILLGLQWGDEGKGKIVDVLSPGYDLIARFQGGPNAGHTLEFDDKKIVLNTIPSGVFYDNTLNLIGNGVVIDPVALKNEINKLKDYGHDLLEKGNLVISKRAHLILPTHKLLDTASENKKGAGKIGSTQKGIAPTYTDKTGRSGLRMGDILLPDFKEKYQQLKTQHIITLEALYETTPDIKEEEKAFFEAIDYLKQFRLVDAEILVNKYLKEGKKILAEGAQGTLLDIDFGAYPYVTSSSTISAGACIGLGVAPQKIGEVIGVFKAYCTRVGSGPFPTELDYSVGDTLRELGNEYGAVSGRPRRTGWLDLPALRYAILLNGVTQLVMTKADVLSHFDEIYVCTHYKYNGVQMNYMPYEIASVERELVLKSFKGWEENISEVRSESEIPENLQAYINFLEAELEVPVKYLSVGPDRVQTIVL